MHALVSVVLATVVVAALGARPLIVDRAHDVRITRVARAALDGVFADPTITWEHQPHHRDKTRMGYNRTHLFAHSPSGLEYTRLNLNTGLIPDDGLLYECSMRIFIGSHYTGTTGYHMGTILGVVNGYMTRTPFSSPVTGKTYYIIFHPPVANSFFTVAEEPQTVQDVEDAVSFYEDTLPVDDYCAAYILSGVDVLHPSYDNVVGLARVAGSCTDQNVALSFSDPDASVLLSTMVVIHEVLHLLGSAHDTEQMDNFMQPIVSEENDHASFKSRHEVAEYTHSRLGTCFTLSESSNRFLTHPSRLSNPLIGKSNAHLRLVSIGTISYTLVLVVGIVGASIPKSVGALKGTDKDVWWTYHGVTARTAWVAWIVLFTVGTAASVALMLTE